MLQAASAMAPPSFSELDYSSTMPAVTSTGGGMVNYMLNEAPPPDHFGSGSSQMMDRSFSTFADVLQFADFGPKLALHHHSNDPGDSTNHHMLRFPVLNNHHHHHESHDGDDNGGDADDLGADNYFPDQPHQENINSNDPAMQLEFLGASGSIDQMMAMNTATATGTSSDPIMNNKNKNNSNGKRKRARIVKTNEEVESQRRTHIAVERNRRKQMNEHLRVLRSLMPSSYVQRGDQASIVGGAIEFVRELEQLLQCLESQKRRRLYGESSALPLPNSQPFDPNNGQIINDTEENLDGLMMVGPIVTGPAVVGVAGLQEETAENKSAIADIEVKLLGFDAFIKILSRRRPGQLIKAISALQDLQFTILHTNVTTIEQTVLYSFNVKIGSETRFSADDIASSVQQIFTFIHTNTPM